MSNHERGRKLMAAALEYLGEMDAAIARASWNITVRHAQDVVELVMKAVHDTADVFIAGLARRQMGLNDDEAAEDARCIHGLCTRLVAAIEERQRQSESGASESAASDPG